LKVLPIYSVQPECTLWFLAGNPVEFDSCFPRLFRVSSCAVESATRVYHRALTSYARYAFTRNHTSTAAARAFCHTEVIT